MRERESERKSGKRRCREIKERGKREIEKESEGQREREKDIGRG